MTDKTPKKKIHTSRQVLFASMVGTTVEFLDFYIYATAAVLVFPQLFFPASNPVPLRSPPRHLRYRLSCTPGRLHTFGHSAWRANRRAIVDELNASFHDERVIFNRKSYWLAHSGL